MQLSKTNADILIPDSTDSGRALERTTHLGIGAHPDDLEIMALHGIFECFGKSDQWFTGVTCTDGRGSSRTGVYASCSDDDMVLIRQEEQRVAARMGRYSAMLQLMHTSAEARDVAATDLLNDLEEILKATGPEIVYTHNPADKHATHIGIVTAVLTAIRRLPASDRPRKVYGCEVWRDLDWMPDDRKVVLDCSGHENLARALIGIFDSQISGGKRYDLAAIGRQRANATYLDSHAVDTVTAATNAIDLTPVIQEGGPDVIDYVDALVGQFRKSVKSQLTALKRD